MVAYCTVAQIKEHLQDANLGADYDAALTSGIDRASELIDLFTKRPYGAYKVTADSTRYFDGNGSTDLIIDEIIAAPTSISVAEYGLVDDSTGTGGDYTLWSASQYMLYPYNAPSLGLPYEMLIVNTMSGEKMVWYKYQKSVKIVGKFGFSAEPPKAIVEAVIIQTVLWFKRGQQAFQEVGADGSFGMLRYMLAKQNLDRDVELILQNFVRTTI